MTLISLEELRSAGISRLFLTFFEKVVFKTLIDARLHYFLKKCCPASCNYAIPQSQYFNSRQLQKWLKIFCEKWKIQRNLANCCFVKILCFAKLMSFHEILFSWFFCEILQNFLCNIRLKTISNCNQDFQLFNKLLDFLHLIWGVSQWWGIRKFCPHFRNRFGCSQYCGSAD